MRIDVRCRTALALLAALLIPVFALAQFVELSTADRIRLDALAREQAREDAKYHAEMKAFKERLLRSAPLPAARNPLLGRWTVVKSSASAGKDELSQLFSVLSNPGNAMCRTLFGDGTTEFKPTTWSSIDSFGDDSLGPIQYRGDGKKVWAVPEGALNIYFLTFEVVSPDRVNMILVEDCPMVRAGAAAGGASNAPAPSPAPARGATPGPSAGPAAAPGRAAAPPAPPAPPVPAAAAYARPSDEICRSTFLDKLGTAGINQVRQMVDLRFKDSQQSAVPNSTLTRVEARGSACDDPRVSAMRYDFDTNGMLQVVTYVWAGPPPLFAERLKALSLFYTLPPAQAGRLEMDVPLGRLTVQDVPERNQVLESYAAKK